jgi:biopolymer transport protein ExbD
MAVTTAGSSLPAADNEDAWIVTVTKDGSLYFGTELFTPQGLSNAMRSRPRARSQDLYIKIDARAPFASAKRVLVMARENRFRRVYLLTAQPSDAQGGSIVPPTGLEVWIAPESEAAPIIVHLGQAQGLPVLRINGEPVPFDQFAGKLSQLLHGSDDGPVVVDTEQVLFSNVAHVLDLCNRSGAKVIVRTAEL